MSPIRCWPLLALFLLLSGCYSDNTLEGTLEELEVPNLQVALASPGLLQLGAGRVKGLDKCLRFTGRASLGGKALEQVEAGGGWTFAIPFEAPQIHCRAPAWRFDPSAITEGVSEFEVSDGTGRLLFGVSALAAPRSLSFHGPVPGPVPGGPVTLDWSPATDRLDIAEVTLDGVGIHDAHELVIRDGRIGFRLPSTVSPGPHTLGLEVQPQAGVAHCEPDPGACFTWLPHDLAPTSPEVSITVQ